MFVKCMGDRQLCDDDEGDIIPDEIFENGDVEDLQITDYAISDSK